MTPVSGVERRQIASAAAETDPERSSCDYHWVSSISTNHRVVNIYRNAFFRTGKHQLAIVIKSLNDTMVERKTHLSDHEFKIVKERKWQ